MIFNTIILGILSFIGSIMILVFYKWIIEVLKSVSTRNYMKAQMYNAIAKTFSDAFESVNDKKSNFRVVKGDNYNGDRKGD